MTASAARAVPAYTPHSSPPPTPAEPMPFPLPSGVTPPAEGSCPRCAKAVEPGLPFCGHCGTRVMVTDSAVMCGNCGTPYVEGIDVFCSQCGTRVGQRVSVEDTSLPAPTGRQRTTGPRVALLDESGGVAARFSLDKGDAVVGRGDADIRLDDVYLSPLHARLEVRSGELWVRDLGSRNGTWTFIEEPTSLSDGDIMLIGSQLIRFRRLGYPGPHPPEADSTRRMGSVTPSADIAVLEQLRADSSVRDSFHLSPARNVQIGRESGDWVFPYDQTMSGRHAEIRTQDAEFFVRDMGSRNGVALAVRGERAVRAGQRVLVGDQILRIESITT
jgi:pSer/pThr/pTyr-binding forkhead associated (FHA) protein